MHKNLQALAQKLSSKKADHKEADYEYEDMEEDEEEEKLTVAALNPMIKLLLSILKNGPGK